MNLLKIPAPKWHEHDGGYYIGTGDMVIMRHPDTGWINYGAYRVQVHDKNVASVMCSKGKHGDMIQKKYHERGLPCPVAVVCGMHPALFMIAGLEIPHGKNEYDVAGGLLRRSLEARGLKFLIGAQTQALIGGKDGRVTAVQFKDGSEIPADLVVMAAGIRPNTTLAEKIGLYCDWPVSKGCTPPYVPVWVEAMVKRQG